MADIKLKIMEDTQEDSWWVNLLSDTFMFQAMPMSLS